MTFLGELPELAYSGLFAFLSSTAVLLITVVFSERAEQRRGRYARDAEIRTFARETLTALQDEIARYLSLASKAYSEPGILKFLGDQEYLAPSVQVDGLDDSQSRMHNLAARVMDERLRAMIGEMGQLHTALLSLDMEDKRRMDIAIMKNHLKHAIDENIRAHLYTRSDD